jgi:hypothetical protein
MTRRLLIWLLIIVGFLSGCNANAAAQPDGSTTTNGATAIPESVEATSTSGSLPGATTVDSTEVPGENADPASSPTPQNVEPTATVDIHCTETDPHPIGQSIAETYETSYEEVMTFFCTGVSFDDIVLAYQTAELAEIDVNDALTLWYDYGNWDDVWLELGIE